MWTPATRRQHNRESLRYETDLTDREWDLISPMMPEVARTGRPSLAAAWDHERDFLRHARRHRLATSAVRLSAQKHSVPVVLPLSRRMPAREDQPPASDRH